MEKKRVLFVVNPASGPRNDSADEFAAQVSNYIDNNVIDYQVAITQNEQHASELSRKAVEDHIDIVVAVGGDGTVNEVARNLIGTNTALGIIPAGSGNGLAHHLNIPFNMADAISSINKGRVLLMDTVRVNNIPFLSIAGIGFDALVADKFAGNTSRGWITYFNIVSTEYYSYRPLNYELTIDGVRDTYKALFISFANSDQFGYNTTIAPEARVDDGVMDVCIVKKVPIFTIPFVAPMLFIRQVHRTPYVDIVKAREVIVHTRATLVVNIDGEPVTMKGPLRFKLIPLSLKVVIP
ncbi:MAG: YegS/Rv2252/BmrU family lipid kinase [Bacteroidota bacterium]|nr:YegS/Rv2252/BmrU family lipid kinase [Bacteroidota bacterium]